MARRKLNSLSFSTKLVFKFEGMVSVKKVSEATRYMALVEFLCSRWSVLRCGSFSLMYNLVNHGECILVDDDDVGMMMEYAEKCLLDEVVINVTLKDGVVANERIDVSQCLTGSHTTVVTNASVGSLSRAQSQNRRVMLSSNWSYLISDVGQVFEHGVEEFRKCLVKFAYQSGFLFDYVKNERTRVTAVCKQKEIKKCPWRIHASADKSNGFFYIRTFNKVHNCGVALSRSKKIRMSTEIVGELMVGDVRIMPTMRPTDVVRQVKDKYGIDITYYVAWNATDKARGAVFGDHRTSYSAINSYFKEAERANPGSVFDLQYNHETMAFKRCFFTFSGCLIGFRACRPIISIDGTFLKGKFGGILLSVVSKDVDDGLFPIAFAIVHEENDDNWFWFLNLLKASINDDRVITFISDRQHGILQGVRNVFPDCFHCFCLRHLIGNLNNKLKGVTSSYRDAIVGQFVSCAYEFSKTLFDKKIEKLKESGKSKVVNFLNDLPYTNWANAYFEGQRYGEMYSNGVESWNSQILDFRDLPIMTMIDSIRSELMSQMTRRRDKAANWLSPCCPKYEEVLQDLESEGRSWETVKAADTIYEVLCNPSMVVDLAQKTCTCREWQILGFPCVHAVCVLVNCIPTPYDYIDKFFYTSYYRECYAYPIYPFVTHSVSEDGFCVGPPELKSRRGRPKKKRIPSVGEKIKRKIRCGRCNELGNHNSKSCKKPM